jgi:hypothetical protein
VNYLVDDIGAVVTSVRNQSQKLWLSDPSAVSTTPYYMYGHRLEINNRLVQKSKGDFKYQLYPLIALRMDFEEDIDNGLIKYNLNLAILNRTEKNYNAEERYTNVFKPILYPLYEAFMDKLKKAGIFQWDGNYTLPPHTKIDRPYYGTSSEEQNVKNIFSDTLDAIEIIGLKLSQRIKRC